MMKMMHYPTVKQRTHDDCGAACVSSILRYHSRRHQYVKLCKQLKLSKIGVDESEMVKFLRAEGFKAELMDNLTIDGLLECLKGERPVIMIIQAWSRRKTETYACTDYGHYVLAIGYNEDRIVFMDPALPFGTYGFVTREELDKRWYLLGEGSSMRRVGIVVDPGDERRVIHID
jgi:ABC-type bacteriocin/lantibiotic exporter with double-glycine peptidase domain